MVREGFCCVAASLSLFFAVHFWLRAVPFDIGDYLLRYSASSRLMPAFNGSGMGVVSSGALVRFRWSEVWSSADNLRKGILDFVCVDEYWGSHLQYYWVPISRSCCWNVREMRHNNGVGIIFSSDFFLLWKPHSSVFDVLVRNRDKS